MRRSQIVAPTVASLALLLATAVPGIAQAHPGAAADTTPPALVGITFSPGSVAVAGLDLVPVIVGVHLTDESGVVRGLSFDLPTPFVVLERGSGGDRREEPAELTLTSGTAQDGVWSATIQVPSTWDGTWPASRVIAGDSVGNELDVDPRTLSIDSRLSVTGTHQPALTLRQRPDPVVGDAPLTLEGRAYFLDTGEGIPNQELFFGFDNQCVENEPTVNGATDARGDYSRTFAGRDNIGLRCVGIPRPSNIANVPAFITAVSMFPRVKFAVSATARSTTVPVGGRVTITGGVVPVSDGVNVQLQRLVGTSWHTVDRSTTRDGRFTLTDTPRSAGSHRYRVFLPNTEEDLRSVSRTIVVRVGASGEGDLPVTGSPVVPIVLVAIALIVVGGALMLIVRRRASPTP